MLAPLCLRRLKAEVELGMPPLVETRIREAGGSRAGMSVAAVCM